jgi:DNA repair protein RecN (Recombination protein N)
MMKSLHIRNYAIIEALDMDFANGLTIITGETGAGKSILLGALGLIMGNRADTKSLYNENEKCVIEAHFDVRNYYVREFFGDNDMDYEDEVVLRRELTPSGKSRAFINDTPVNLKQMQELCQELVDLHQQFDTLDIHSLSFQLKMIDALASNKSQLNTYQTIFRSFQANRRELSALRQRSEQSAKEIDFIQFQLEELSKASLNADEQEKLEEELSRLTHAEDIKRVLGGGFQLLTENEHSIASQLHDLNVALNQVSKYDSTLGSFYERFSSILLEIRELGNDFEKVADQTEFDPERISEVQLRLDLIYRLQKKHTVATIKELLEVQDTLEKTLGGYGDLSNEMARLEQEIAEQDTSLRQMAEDLSERRRAVIPTFEEKIVEMLGQLAMPNAQIQIQCRTLPELDITGSDEINFLFSANKGGRLQTIKDVASGGELSRLALVTKSLVASAIPLPTLIFDEIDSGISGDVALKMGTILRKLSNEHQVVTITHSPQVASKADRHYFVYKKETEERTLTNVRLLNADERVRAIATMLSQNPPSDSALENARELLAMK